MSTNSLPKTHLGPAICGWRETLKAHLSTEKPLELRAKAPRLRDAAGLSPGRAARRDLVKFKGSLSSGERTAITAPVGVFILHQALHAVLYAPYGI